MDVLINVQSVTRALPGTVEAYWFENAFVKLPLTLFHRMYIPLAPFAPQLGYGPNILKTQIMVEWLDLKLPQPSQLDGLHISHQTHPETECSIYVGNAHNCCVINEFTLTHRSERRYQLKGDLWVHFEYEGVASGEPFTFATEMTYRGVV